jgi:predicted neuraminidase
LQAPPAPHFVVPTPPRASANEAPRLSSALINEVEPPQVHAAAVAELSDGRLAAVWFGGSREGARDVRIIGAEGAPQADGDTIWRSSGAVATPQATGAGLRRLVRKLGNPVVFGNGDSENWMVYVSAFSGWATSQLNLLRAVGTTPKRLVTSPFFNMSTLVKTPAIHFADGDVGLPVYHELAGKFGELLVLTPDGEVRRKIRISHGRRTLQPVVLVEDATHAVALLRDASAAPPRVWRSETADAGQSWSALEATDLPNPNSALTAVRLDDGRLLAVANDTENKRLRLTLLVSADRGHHWHVVHRFEDRDTQPPQSMPETDFRARLEADVDDIGPAHPAKNEVVADVLRNTCKDEACHWQYDYPYLIRAADGDFHLVYTWNRSFIRHVRFNSVWLQAKLEATR